MKKTSAPLLLALALSLLAGCAASSSNTGSAQLAVSVPQALSSSDITRVKVTVSASDMPSLVVDLAKSNGSWGGLIGNIPAGANRSVLAEAFDSSSTLRFQGQASPVSISANLTTAVALTLQELAPPPPYSNEAPVIDSLVASSTSVQSGASISLTATVHDPNAGDTLSLAWTASGGSFSAPTAAATSWTAPSTVGAQTLTFTVTDSQGAAVSVSLAVNVVSGTSTGNAALNISFNLFPVVSKVSASLNRLDAGQSTSVSATASDADGDALSYQWTATCPGSWTNATSSAASFVPSSVPASACNNCTLTVTVQDGHGGQTTGSLKLCVAASSTERFAPLFTNFYQSATAISPGQTVSFDVTGMDPQSSALTFAWTANVGSLAAAQNTATTSHMVWTAPSCATASTPTSITATVTNAFNQTATQSFSVTGLPACASGWTSTGAMTTLQADHTAMLMNNGKVLVAGGQNPSGTISTTEVYDVASGTWSATAPMASKRSLYGATLLPNGKVLVTGGFVNGGVAAASELYDPASGAWSAAGSMISARYYHTATLLPNGKVLIAGGQAHGGGNYASAELYDPATGTWSATGSMASAHAQHTATLLPDGKVLVAGGSTLASAELYDPASGTWSATGPMVSLRYFHTATLLNNGKVLVTGGNNNSNGYYSSAEVYDPASNTWSATASMASARGYHTATLLNTGKVLVAGGSPDGSASLATAEVYDPASSTWSAIAPMASARGHHTATVLPNGKILFSGGYTGSSYLASAELYTP